jgi:hypothetical protein
MGVKSEYQDAFNFAVNNPSTAEDARMAGFYDSLKAGAQSVFSEDLVSSKWYSESDIRTQKRKIAGQIADGTIPPELVDQFTTKEDPSVVSHRPPEHKIDYAGLGDHYANITPDEYKTNAQLQQERMGLIETRRANAAEMSERSGFAGHAGQFFGGLAASFIDIPTVAASVALPVVNPVVTGSARALSYAKYGMIGAAVIEPTYQAKISSYKEELGVEYGWGDALVNAGMSITAGGLIGGLTGAVKHLKASRKDIQAARDDATKNGDIDVVEQLDDVLESRDQLQKELESAPDKTISPEEHDKALVTQAEELNKPTRTDQGEIEQQALFSEIDLEPAPKVEGQESVTLHPGAPENVKKGFNELEELAGMSDPEAVKAMKELADMQVLDRKTKALMACLRG